jgi:hypothetical protein
MGTGNIAALESQGLIAPDTNAAIYMPTSEKGPKLDIAFMDNVVITERQT